MAIIDPFMAIIGLASLIIAAGCGILTLVAVLVWHRRRTSPALQRLPPVSVLKPLCGAEPGLYVNLRSFCQQDYPEYQIVFGMRDPQDPALAAVKRLVAEFPSQPIDVVINPQQHGSNCKVSNLINIIALARHDVFAMADSDACVGPDYLRMVSTAPLQEPKRRAGDLPIPCDRRRLICSRLGAMYVNEWYMPSSAAGLALRLSAATPQARPCVIRHETLQAIGGCGAIANHLAEDHRLGELVRELGLRIVLSPDLLSAEHHEPQLRMRLPAMKCGGCGQYMCCGPAAFISSF